MNICVYLPVSGRANARPFITENDDLLTDFVDTLIDSLFWEKKKNPVNVDSQGFMGVCPAGFEPVTFRVGVIDKRIKQRAVGCCKLL